MDCGGLICRLRLYRKSQPEVAIALRGLFRFIDFGVTFITGWNGECFSLFVIYRGLFSLGVL